VAPRRVSNADAVQNPNRTVGNHVSLLLLQDDDESGDGVGIGVDGCSHVI